MLFIYSVSRCYRIARHTAAHKSNIHFSSSKIVAETLNVQPSDVEAHKRMGERVIYSQQSPIATNLPFVICDAFRLLIRYPRV